MQLPKKNPRRCLPQDSFQPAEHGLEPSSRGELMLPDSKGLESEAPELSKHGLRPSTIALYLLAPVISIRYGERAIAGRAPVPEAAIDKDGDSSAEEREVGHPRKVTNMHPPVFERMTHQEGTESPLSGTVATRSNPAHPLAAFSFCQEIHGSSR